MTHPDMQHAQEAAGCFDFALALICVFVAAWALWFAFGLPVDAVRIPAAAPAEPARATRRGWPVSLRRSTTFYDKPLGPPRVRVPIWDYNKAKEAGEKTRVHKSSKKDIRHTYSICENRLLASTVDDYLVIARKLAGYDGTVHENDFDGVIGRAATLRDIRIIVDKYNI